MHVKQIIAVTVGMWPSPSVSFMLIVLGVSLYKGALTTGGKTSGWRMA